MARVDSGHETLFSDEEEEDSPTPTCDESSPAFVSSSPAPNSAFISRAHHHPSSSSSATILGGRRFVNVDGVDLGRPAPPKLTPVSGVLGQGKVVIRPIAFKPVMSPTVRYQSTGGERYCSTPSLPRAASHISHYGSTTDLRVHGNPSSFSLDRKLAPQSSKIQHYHSQDNVVKTSLHHAYHQYHHLHSGASASSSEHKYANTYCDQVVDTPQSFSNMSTMQRIGGSMGSVRPGGGTGGGTPSVMSGSIGGSSLHLDCLGMTTSSVSGSQLNLEDLQQTPSPSDSGVAELEAMLKEKDSEINYLRETMEQNEQVIFKVYEEKEKMWERELRKIKGMYENRLKASQQKALKMEQMLMMQTYQLQQEKRKLRQDLEECRMHREQAERRSTELQREVEALRVQLEETEWALCQKSGEISLLKSQLKDSQGDQTTKGHEMLHLRAQVREYKAELERKDQEVKHLQDQTASLRKEGGELKGQLEDSLQSLHARGHRDDLRQLEMRQQEAAKQQEELSAQLQAARAEKESMREGFEEERVTWMEEKEKVIRYQKQLQLNYVHMYRRTRTLEGELEELARQMQGGNGAGPKLKSPGQLLAGKKVGSSLTLAAGQGEAHC